MINAKIKKNHCSKRWGVSRSEEVNTCMGKYTNIQMVQATKPIMAPIMMSIIVDNPPRGSFVHAEIAPPMIKSQKNANSVRPDAVGLSVWFVSVVEFIIDDLGLR